MGKFMRKPKTTRDVGVMDVSHSTIGVCTRAKTLALERLHQYSPPPLKHDYLELRSRRLEKPSLLKQNSQKTPSAPKQGFVCTDTENPQKIEGSPENPRSQCGFPMEPVTDGCFERQMEIGDSEIEASLGENNLDSEARERCTRESTPCSMIRAADTSTIPGSSTRRRSPSVVGERTQNMLRNIPTACEMEDFFAHVEQPQQRRFIEKYNFDIVNDLPLPGRYEWVRVMP